MTLGRRGLLFGILALTLLAAIWPLPDANLDGDAVNPARRDRGRDTPARQTPAFADTLKAPSAKEVPIIDMFPRQTWAQAPSSLSSPAKIEPPTPPPLPFGFGGRYTEGSKTVVFLTEGTLVHTASLGDTVKGAYRIDAIGADSITLTYLPLGRQQLLAAPTPSR